MWLNWYAKPGNRERHNKNNGGYSRQIFLRNREYVLNVLRANPCADCGTRDHRVLEFDHVRGKKLGNISNMVKGYSIARIQAEIDKCEIVCANCHRIRTGARSSYFGHTQGD